MLLFGVGFEFPLLVAMLNFAGVVSAKRLLGWWRIAVFLMFLFAAMRHADAGPVQHDDPGAVHGGAVLRRGRGGLPQRRPARAPAPATPASPTTRSRRSSRCRRWTRRRGARTVRRRHRVDDVLGRWRQTVAVLRQPGRRPRTAPRRRDRRAGRPARRRPDGRGARRRAAPSTRSRPATRRSPTARPRLVAVGGDGTVHLALQAVAGTGVPFGVVPAGTGNDFAVAGGDARRPGRGGRALIAAALAEGRTRAGRPRPDDRAGRLRALVRGRAGGRLRRDRQRAGQRDALATRAAAATTSPSTPSWCGCARAGTRSRSTARPGRSRTRCSSPSATPPRYGGGHADHARTRRPTTGCSTCSWPARCRGPRWCGCKPRLYPGTHVDHAQCSMYRVRSIEIAADGDRHLCGR